MLRPMFTSEAFRDFAEAGNSKPPGDDATKKDNKLEATINLLKGPFLDEALHA